MTIEKFELRHLDAVWKIENECFADPWSREDLEAQLSLDTSHFYVAVENGIVAGYMGLQIFSGEGYVTNVAVLPQFRGKGYAQALISECMKNEMEFITLEVRESNTPAYNLYLKMGFDNVGIRPKFYSNPTENAIIMTKKFK